MPEITNDFDALVTAFILAATAPTLEDRQSVIRVTEILAERMDADEIERACEVANLHIMYAAS